MNGKQRLEAVLSGREPDRVPVLASTLAHAAWTKRIPQHDFHTHAATLASTVVAVSRELEIDGVYVSSDNWIIHEALGGEVVFPEDDEPWGIHGPLVREWSDLESLHLPNPQQDGRMPMMLDAARRVVELVNQELYVEANIDSGPFQIALMLRGFQQGYLDVIEEPQKMHDLIEFALQVSITYGRAMAQTGVDAIQFGESSASVVAPKIFRELVLPYDQRLIAALKEENIKAVLHVCGDSTHLLDSLACSGADWLEIDALVPLEKAFAAVRSSMVIRGNVDTTLLLNGPTQCIWQAANACLGAAEKTGGRLILSPGCGVPKFTPPEHIRILVAAAQAASQSW